MSPAPVSIQRDQNLVQAHVLMREHHIRHLPVLDGDSLVGVLTSRDISQLEALMGTNPREVLVADAMSTEVYAVSPETPLDEVAAEMARRKVGCTIVLRDRQVLGLVTTVDVCSALADLLRDQLRA